MAELMRCTFVARSAPKKLRVKLSCTLWSDTRIVKSEKNVEMEVYARMRTCEYAKSDGKKQGGVLPDNKTDYLDRKQTTTTANDSE